jgi:putative PIN family toxin of toxin-antitoxin system
MVDTNVLLAALVFGSKNMTDLIAKIADEHTMVLCSYIIDEFRDVVTKKSPKYSDIVDELFAKLSFEMVYTPKWNENMPDIRDEKDKPILAAAIVSDVDIIVSSDEDFTAVDIERPQILSPLQLMERL